MVSAPPAGIMLHFLTCHILWPVSSAALSLVVYFQVTLSAQCMQNISHLFKSYWLNDKAELIIFTLLLLL